MLVSGYERGREESYACLRLREREESYAEWFLSQATVEPEWKHLDLNDERERERKVMLNGSCLRLRLSPNGNIWI